MYLKIKTVAVLGIFIENISIATPSYIAVTFILIGRISINLFHPFDNIAVNKIKVKYRA